MDGDRIEQLKKLLRESLLEEDLPIQAGDHLVRDLGMDSMGYVDLTVKVELALGIVIPEKVIREAETFQDFVDLVAKHNANG